MAVTPSPMHELPVTDESHVRLAMTAIEAALTRTEHEQERIATMLQEIGGQARG